MPNYAFGVHAARTLGLLLYYNPTLGRLQAVRFKRQRNHSDPANPNYRSFQRLVTETPVDIIADFSFEAEVEPGDSGLLDSEDEGWGAVHYDPNEEWILGVEEPFASGGDETPELQNMGGPPGAANTPRKVSFTFRRNVAQPNRSTLTWNSGGRSGTITFRDSPAPGYSHGIKITLRLRDDPANGVKPAKIHRGKIRLGAGHPFGPPQEIVSP